MRMGSLRTGLATPVVPPTAASIIA